MNHPCFPPVSLLRVQQQGLHCFSHSNFASLRGSTWMMSSIDGRTFAKKGENPRPASIQTWKKTSQAPKFLEKHKWLAPSAPRAKAHAILLALCAVQAFGVLCRGVKTQSLPARRQGIACQKQRASALKNHTTCFMGNKSKQTFGGTSRYHIKQTKEAGSSWACAANSKTSKSKPDDPGFEG